jgi:geranylgeranyl diphosphate synthase, type II
LRATSRKRADLVEFLKAYMEDRRAVVEEALERFLPPTDADSGSLHEAMRYAVFSGGKRLRPILALSSFELVGGQGGGILAPASALELIHTYSLIHDDLPAMDDDDVRRGRPTCHKAFGEAMAILAGDALLTLAFEIVAGDVSLEAARRVAVIEELARANGSRGMAGGQAADIALEGAPPSLDAIMFIHTNKTALPLAAAVRVGALAAGAAQADLDALTAYGRKAGLAFQITDDLLDVTGTAEEMGKAVGKDIARGKMTYPGVVGVEAAGKQARDLLDEAIGALARFGPRARPLVEIATFIGERRR